MKNISLPFSQVEKLRYKKEWGELVRTDQPASHVSCLHHTAEYRAVTVKRKRVQEPRLNVTSSVKLGCPWVFSFFMQCRIYMLCNLSDSCPRNNTAFQLQSELNHCCNRSQLWWGEWSTYRKLKSQPTYLAKIPSKASPLPASCFVSAQCKCKFIKNYEKTWPLSLYILQKRLQNLILCVPCVFHSFCEPKTTLQRHVL